MAVVRTRTLRFNGREYRQVTRVNRDGLFRIKYPEELVKLLGEPDEAVATTQKEVDQIWGARAKEFTEAQTTRRKVIVYRVQIMARLWTEEKLLDRDDISFGHGLGVLLWADVFEEIEVKLAMGSRYTYERIRDNNLPSSVRHPGKFDLQLGSLGKKESNVMEWTEEREEFFCKVGELMEGLAIKLDDMTKDPELFAVFAQEQKPLLGGKDVQTED